MTYDTYLQRGADAPYAEDHEQFESDVYRFQDQWYDDLQVEVDIHVGYQGGSFVAVQSVADVTGTFISEWETTPVFYSVDEFRKWIEERYAPEDYR